MLRATESCKNCVLNIHAIYFAFSLFFRTATEESFQPFRSGCFSGSLWFPCFFWPWFRAKRDHHQATCGTTEMDPVRLICAEWPIWQRYWTTGDLTFWLRWETRWLKITSLSSLTMPGSHLSPMRLVISLKSSIHWKNTSEIWLKNSVLWKSPLMKWNLSLPKRPGNGWISPREKFWFQKRKSLCNKLMYELSTNLTNHIYIYIYFMYILTGLWLRLVAVWW